MPFSNSCVPHPSLCTPTTTHGQVKALNIFITLTNPLSLTAPVSVWHLELIHDRQAHLSSSAVFSKYIIAEETMVRETERFKCFEVSS